MFAVVTTVSQVAQKSTRPIWMLEKLSLASMGGAAASADRAPPSGNSLSGLRQPLKIPHLHRTRVGSSYTLGAHSCCATVMTFVSFDIFVSGWFGSDIRSKVRSASVLPATESVG
jgi:hypothetical protein